MKLPFGFQIGRPPREKVRLSDVGRQHHYDAAATTRHNTKHWLPVTAGDADSCIAPSLEITRNRARYELANNSYAKGITETFATELVGTGPRIQVKSGDPDWDRAVEDRFMEWTGDGDSIRDAYCDIGGRECYSDILRLVASISWDENGEGLLILTTDDKQPRRGPDAGVSLRLMMVEPDRLQTPYGMIDGQTGPAGGKINMGIEQDDYGRPLNYFVLKHHPGSQRAAFLGAVMGAYNVVPADYVLHLMRPDRVGQSRGVPIMAPSLELFAQMRDFTASTLSAAKTAAYITGTMETQDGTVDAEGAEYEAMDVVDVERDTLLVMPDGRTAKQFKPEQPASTYKEFKGELINEAARPRCMPFNIAAANSAGYNYASGRLDHQTFFKFKNVLRHWINRHCSRSVIRQWLREAVLIKDFLPDRKAVEGKFPPVQVRWFWTGDGHVDPVKEAVAERTRLHSLTTTLADVYGAQGEDWERKIEQIAKERVVLKENDLTIADVVKNPQAQVKTKVQVKK